MRTAVVGYATGNSGILAGRGRRLAIWLGWILFWQFLALVAGNPLLVPSPLETVRKLWVLLQKLDFYQAVGSTLLRISAGALCGFLVAAALAAVTASRFWGRSFPP